MQGSLQFISDQEVLCDGSFGLLEINGGLLLNFLGPQKSVSQTVLLGWNQVSHSSSGSPSRMQWGHLSAVVYGKLNRDAVCICCITKLVSRPICLKSVICNKLKF